MPALKEPHFFNRDGPDGVRTLREYEYLFLGATARHSAVGEASTHYLFSKIAVPQILEYSPESRFIVCIRNPIDMAPALHAERVWQGRERVTRFEDAWRREQERERGRLVSSRMTRADQRLRYAQQCRLGEHLQWLYENVGRERVLEVVLDDIISGPQYQYDRVLAFLGISRDERASFPVLNVRKTVRSPVFARLLRHATNAKQSFGISRRFGIGKRLRHVNERTYDFGGDRHVPQDVLAEMKAWFQDDVHRLEDLVGRDFSAWLE